jgi:hypothetical protein
VVVSEHKERLKGEQVLLNNIEVTLKKATASIYDTNTALGKLVKGIVSFLMVENYCS